MSAFARNTIFSTIAGATFLVGRFATTVVLARTLGVADTGVVNYAFWIVGLIGALTDLGVYASLTRYLPELSRKGDDDLGRNLVNYLFYPFLGFVLLTIGGFALFAFLNARAPDVMSAYGLEADPLRIMLVAMLYAGQVLSNFVVGYLQGMQRFSTVALVWFYMVVIQVAGIAIGGYLDGANGAMIGYTIGFLAPCLMIFSAVGSGRRIPAELRSRVLRFAAFSWASSLASALVWARLEMAVLNSYWGVHAVGLYSVGFTLANLAIQGPLQLTGGLLPYFAQNSGPEDRGKAEAMLGSSMRMLAFLALPMCFGTAAIIPIMLPLLFGSSFAEGNLAAEVLVIGSAIGAIVTVPILFINAMERSDVAFKANVTAAILSVVLSFALVPAFGTVGAATARSLVQTCLVALCIWFIVKRLHVRVPLRQLGMMFVASGLCWAVARAIITLWPSGIGMLIAIPIAAIVYFFAIRLFGAILPEDADRLRSMSSKLPRRADRLFTEALLFLSKSERG